MRVRAVAKTPALALRSYRSWREGRDAGIPGLAFDSFGRRLGLRIILAGRVGTGLDSLLNPVSIIRYFEFPFAWDSIPQTARVCADVSSPRLFSLYWAATHPGAEIDVINPDARDLESTRAVARAAGIPLRFQHDDLRSMRDRAEAYDAIWSISVLEHVSGEYDDRDAIRWLYAALRPGGVLVVTVMTARTSWDEHRDADPYELRRNNSGPVFFQRWYDRGAIDERLLGNVSGAAVALRFFGETSPGVFKKYEAEWQRLGLRRTVDDPAEIARHYREYASWEEMPGCGVCGIRIAKPA